VTFTNGKLRTPSSNSSRQVAIINDRECWITRSAVQIF